MPDSVARPLVSVISPTLNQGRFIEATLKSVMRQSYGSIEHIVVDGGSTDETHEILRAYEPRYAMTWFASRDSGMYQAVNRGLARASGEILAYLNTDDLYVPWTVESVVEAFAAQPDVDLVYGDVLKRVEPAGEIRLVFAPSPSRAYMLRTGSLFQPTVFWRRRVLDSSGGFDESLAGGADLDYWLRVMRLHRFAKINEVLAIERLHAAAKSTARAAELRSEERHIRARYDVAPRPVRVMSAFAARGRTWVERRRSWLRFVRLARGDGAADWRRFRDTARPAIDPMAFSLAQLPIIGDRFADRAMRIRYLQALGLD